MVPVATPKTIPLDEPIIATAEVLLTQVPEPGSLSVIDEPAQTADGPEMDEGNGLTVMVAVTKQPVLIVQVIMARPAATPVTTPVAAITVALIPLVLHVAPLIPPSVIDDPIQTLVGPVTGAGKGLTVTGFVRTHPEGNV